MASSADSDRLSAGEAAELLAPRFGGVTTAQKAIAAALRDGLLHAAAEYVCTWSGDKAREHEANGDNLIEIPAQLWRASAHYEADQLSWDWSIGWFEIWSEDGEEDMAIAGVSFARDELVALSRATPICSNLSIGAGELSGGAKQKSRGQRPSFRWAALIQAVLELERDGELVTGRFDGPGELMDSLQCRIPERQRFDDRSIEGVVSYIYHHLLYGPPAKLTETDGN